jgi:hypothetical protein
MKMLKMLWSGPLRARNARMKVRDAIRLIERVARMERSAIRGDINV